MHFLEPIIFGHTMSLSEQCMSSLSDRNISINSQLLEIPNFKISCERLHSTTLSELRISEKYFLGKQNLHRASFYFLSTYPLMCSLHLNRKSDDKELFYQVICVHIYLMFLRVVIRKN